MKKIAYILFILLFFACGCDNMSNPQVGFVNVNKQNFDNVESTVVKKYNELSMPNLVLATGICFDMSNSTTVVRLRTITDNENYNKLNTILGERGLPQIDFVEIVSPHKYDYYFSGVNLEMALKTLTKNGTRIDMVLNPSYMFGDTFLNLAEYYTTNVGEKLFNLFGNRTVDKIDNGGNFYKIPLNRVSSFEHKTFYYKQEILDEFSIKKSALNTNINSVYTLFEKTKNTSTNTEIGISVENFFKVSPLSEDYSLCNDTTLGIVINKGVMRAKFENMFENPDFIQYFNTIYKLQRKGYLLDSTTDNFIMINDNSQLSDKSYYSVSVEESCIDDSINSISIVKESEYSVLAFKTLSKILLDEELRKLIGADFENDNPDDGKSYEAMGFAADFSKVQDETLAIQKVLTDLFTKMDDSIIYGTSDVEPEVYLKDLNRYLYNSGLQLVLDEINSQLDEYYAYLDSKGEK